jgi:hypothetical protein
MLSLGCAIAVLMLGSEVWFVLQPLSRNIMDTVLYWGVGRGIVNDLVPYLDLFEVKPPGIFLLSALSLRMFGDFSLGNMLNAVTLVLIPLLSGWMWMRDAREDRTQRFATGFLTGAAITLYGMLRATPWQTESFGILVSMLYVLLVAGHAGRMRWWQSVLGGVLLLCAIGLKEPFLFPCIGAAILWDKRPTVLMRTLVIPLTIAGVLGLLGLWMFGLWDGFFHVYLPAVFGAHLGVISHAPLWQRVIGMHRPILRLLDLSPLLMMMLGAAVLRPAPETLEQRRATAVTLLTAIIVILGLSWLQQILFEHLMFVKAVLYPLMDGVMTVSGGVAFVMATVFVLISTVTVWSGWRGIARSPTGFMLALTMGVLAILSVLLLPFPANVMLVRLAIGIAAILGFSAIVHSGVATFDAGGCATVFATAFIAFLATAIGGGGSEYHYAFLTPFFLAIALRCARDTRRTPHAHLTRAIVSFTAILALMTTAQPSVPLRQNALQLRAEDQENEKVAAMQIDRILDACGEKRYLMVGREPRWIAAYTAHSPFNLHLHMSLEEEAAYGEHFREEAQTRLGKAALIVTGAPTNAPTSADPEVAATIARDFTTTPWTCAGELGAMTEFRLLFRKNLPRTSASS